MIQLWYFRFTTEVVKLCADIQTKNSPALKQHKGLHWWARVASGTKKTGNMIHEGLSDVKTLHSGL